MSCENVTMLKLAIACPLEVGLSAMVLASDSVLQKSGFAKQGALEFGGCTAGVSMHFGKPSYYLRY